MKCRKCGSQLEKEEKFCSECGAKVSNGRATIFILSAVIVVLVMVTVGICVIYPEYKYKTYLRLGDKYYGELNYEDGNMVAQFHDGQAVIGDYGHAQEVINDVLSQWKLDKDTFFVPDSKENIVCWLSNSTDDLDFYGNCTYEGEIIDYTNLKERIAEREKEGDAIQEPAQLLELVEKVPDFEIEQEILNIREKFNYDMEQTAAGNYRDIIHDNEYDNKEFLKYGEQYLQEGYELYHQAEKMITNQQ